MGYLVLDQPATPRPIGFPSLPPVPPFAVPVAEEVVSGYGQLPTGAIPYLYTGPAQTGGTEVNYRVVGGELEDHASSGAATAFPVSAGHYQARPVWDGNYASSDPTSTTARSDAPATLYTPSLATAVNGSTSPAGVINGATVAVSGTFTLGAEAMPFAGASETGTVTVTGPTGTHVLGPFTLQQQVGNTYTLATNLIAGQGIMTASGVYTIAVEYSGDQINQAQAGPPVNIQVTIS
jgi:hypothetical protein